MSLAQKIKDAVQSAQQPRKNILKLIVGELDRVAKTPTDKQTEAVLLFLIKSATETQDTLFMKDIDKYHQLQYEIEVYNEFLPPQPKVLTKKEIESVVKDIAPLTVPQLMRELAAYEKDQFVTIDKGYARTLL